MNWHLLAFEKASAGGVTLEDTPGIQDDIIATNAAGHYLMPRDLQILFGYVLSPNATAAQLSTPHARVVALPAIEPMDIGVTPTTLPAIGWYEPPFAAVKGNDDLTMLQSDNAGAGIQKVGLIGLMENYNVNVPQGETFKLRATAANTSNARTWQTQAITFDQTIPGGTYAVIGMQAVGANLIAARLLFPGGGYRPGCIAQTAESIKPDRRFGMGRLGSWGTFTNIAVPSVQLLGSGALVTQVIYLDVVRTG